MNISIIMPVFNAEPFLQKSLQSALSQSLAEIEVICIDDGSTDKSASILEKLSGSDPRIKVVKQRNCGSGMARNRGLKIASGKFVAFIDADDWYPRNSVLADLYHKAIHSNSLICGGSFVRSHEDGEVERNFSGDLSGYQFASESVVHFSDYQFDYGYHRFIYDRDFLLNNNCDFPDYRRYQDPVFFVKAMMLAEKFYAIPQETYTYRKGHQTVGWDPVKVHGLLAGICDNLYMSRVSKLSRLHLSNLRRVCFDFRKPILANIKENTLIRYDLARIRGNLDLDLASQADPDWDKTRHKIAYFFEEVAPPLW